MNATTVPNDLKAQMAVAIEEYMKEHGENLIKNKENKTPRLTRAKVLPLLMVVFVTLFSIVVSSFMILEENDRELRMNMASVSASLDGTNKRLDQLIDLLNKSKNNK